MDIEQLMLTHRLLSSARLLKHFPLFLISISFFRCTDFISPDNIHTLVYYYKIKMADDDWGAAAESAAASQVRYQWKYSAT